MEDIKTIPIEGLLDDLVASVKDATVCNDAIKRLAFSFQLEPMIERRDNNLLITEKIRSEIIRRCEEK